MYRVYSKFLVIDKFKEAVSRLSGHLNTPFGWMDGWTEEQTNKQKKEIKVLLKSS